MANFIIFTKEQSDKIKGRYGRYSELQPIQIFRSKYLAGLEVPFTEVEEYALPLEVLEDDDLKEIKGFLSCFPIYDANYYIKEVSIESNLEVKKIL